ncbi:MAG: hypothetical protein WC238_03755 [Parcubacteria group bacterium]|jgi:hypothetical protein
MSKTIAANTNNLGSFSFDRHIEYTVTLACPEYDAGNPCPGCFLPKMHEAALAKDPRFQCEESGYEVDPNFIIGNLEKIISEGYKIVTLMGGEPLAMGKFNEVVDWISNSKITAALYVGLPQLFLDNKEKLNDRFLLYKEAGLFDPNRFGWLKFSVNKLLLNKESIPVKRSPERTSAMKSYYGLRVAEQLAKLGLTCCIHQTMTAENIDETLKLYDWARKRGIRFSFSPLVWGWRSPKHKNQAELEKQYPFRIKKEHKKKLEKISARLLGDAVDDFAKNKSRLVVPSSALLHLLPIYGYDNDISCFPRKDNSGLHRNGVRPDIQDIYPNGKRRYCIAQDTEDQAKKCIGCFGSAGVDRSNCFYEFESIYFGQESRFLNGDCWLKGATH